MEITIKGEAKEISALVVALQEQKFSQEDFDRAICSAIDHRTESSRLFQ